MIQEDADNSEVEPEDESESAATDSTDELPVNNLYCEYMFF